MSKKFLFVQRPALFPYLFDEKKHQVCKICCLFFLQLCNSCLLLQYLRLPGWGGQGAQSRQEGEASWNAEAKATKGSCRRRSGNYFTNLENCCMIILYGICCLNPECAQWEISPQRFKWCQKLGTNDTRADVEDEDTFDAGARLLDGSNWANNNRYVLSSCACAGNNVAVN